MCYNILRNLASKALILLLSLFILIPSYTNIKAEESSEKELAYFIVEKHWENDLEAERPDEVNITIEGSDGSSYDRVLTSNDNYKGIFALPAENANGDIAYTAFEVLQNDSKYISSAEQSSKIDLSLVKINSDIYNHSLPQRTSTTVNKTDGFASVPVGSIIIDSNLQLDQAKSMKLPDVFEYTENKRAYGDPSRTSLSQSKVRIYYKGETYPYSSGEETIEVLWDNKATNFLTGDKYDVKLVLSNIIIRSAAEDDNFDGTNRATSILVNENDNLQIDTYCVEGYKFSNKPKENVFAVSADISLIVVDELGNPVDGYTQIYITDLDQPDFYYAHKNNTPATRKFDSEYAESVTFKSGVVSDIYVNNSGTYIVNNNFTFWGNNPPASDADLKTSIKALVETNGFTYTWKGSSCTTAIIYKSIETNNYYKTSDYTNIITNSSGFYKIQYYYQNYNGGYDLFSESDVVMKKPNTLATISDSDKLPSPSRTNFILNEEKTQDWQGTVSSDNGLTNPLILKVYFDKTPDSLSEKEYLIIEKQWENDLESERPETINIVIEGDDDSSYTNTLSKSEEYKAVIVLPSKKNDTDINYTVYEVEPEDFKYISTANRSSKLALNGITVPAYIYYKDLQEIANPQVNKTDGFSKVPEGSIILNQNLDLTQAQITLPNGYSYSESLGVYNDFSRKTINNICPRIQFQGSFPHTGSEDEKVILEWEDSAYDYLTGKYYNLRISINNIVIECANNAEHENIASIASYESNCLNMQAYLAGSGEFSTNRASNIFGVSADILVEVVDKNGNPIPGYTQVYIDDIDIPDYKSCFEKYNSDSRINDFHGINTPFNEGVELKQGVVSDVYLNQGTTWIDYGNNKFKSQSGHSNLAGDPRTAIKFLAKTDGYSFTWTGSDCGSAIIFKSQNTNDYPDTSTFTNTFTNTSAFYKVKYFYENEQGEYDLFEETEVRQGRPTSQITVTSDDKVPSKQKLGYSLNETLSEKWSGSLTTNHTKENPLILEVYFDIAPNSSVLVEHRDEETLELLKPAEYVIASAPIGTPYDTSAETFADYSFSKLSSDSAPASGSVAEEIQTVVYLYKKARGTVKVEHRDYDTNELLTEVEIVKDNERVGEPYQTNQKEFENYFFVKHDENSAPESGVVKSHLQTVVYYYGKEEEIPVIEETGSVEVKYVDEETNELIIPREIVKDKAPVGEEYVTEEKVFHNYLFTKMAETSDEPRGLVEVGHKVVIYMYRPVYSEDYTFLSGTPDKELPPEVLGLLPTRADKYFNESSVDADMVPTREVEVPGGKWVFKDWNDPTLIVNREDVHFVGIWVFEAAPLPPVPKGRVSVVYKTVDGEILRPEEVVLEDEIGEPYSTEELIFEGYTFVETTGDDPIGHLEEKDKLVIYLYEKGKEPTPLQPEPVPTGTVCVVYKDDEGNILEKENCFLVDVPVDTPYDTEKKTFSEYNFKTIEGEPSGKVIKGTIKITYIYSKIKKGTVEVIYVDDSGKTLKGPDVVLKDVEVGKDYSTSKLSFDGYEFSKVDEKSAPVSGKVKEGTQRVIYVYKKTPTVTNVPVNTGVGDTVMFISLALFASSILLIILKRQKQKIGS